MRAVILAVALALSVAARGKSAEEKAAEQAAEDLKKADGGRRRCGDQDRHRRGCRARASPQEHGEGHAGHGRGARPARPAARRQARRSVAFQTLQTHLPTVDGWERGAVEGERMTSPVPFSQVETAVHEGRRAASTSRSSTPAIAQMLIAPWSMFLAAGYSSESTNGYEKSTTVGGNPASRSGSQAASAAS